MGNKDKVNDNAKRAIRSVTLGEKKDYRYKVEERVSNGKIPR
jgi:hypothetical protein